MDSSKNQQDVNSSYTSDGEARSNLMTRDEFLRKVLYSGELTKIAQHVALVVFLVAEGRNQLKLSLRDLERITGWDREAIKDHITELEIFMRVTLGTGRAKAIWDLQGVIEDALAAAVVAGSASPRSPQNKRMASRVATSVVAAEVATNSFVAGHVAANPLVAGQVAASLMAGVAATTPFVAAQAATIATVPPFVAGQGATTVPSIRFVAAPVATTPSLERERESNNNINLSLSTTPRASEKAAEEEDPIKLNGVAIYGPDFKISYASIDQTALLIGMPKERARAIVEIHARDWAMNGNKPDRPMAMITRILKNDVNEGQVQEVKLEKARAANKSVESAGDKIRRFAAEAEEQMKKGGRS